ncbi:DUF4345 domain-containing protein [Rhodovarius crocodyli]|uniref:DUF4345 domain-containing protein n=1 Tax=Rhodovarius crocodyli TaxID=1979269 RepID=A0A437M3Q8_9PROT|nr:DUF4345 domain-containing protein [Rhodovarius crocodyli]RVT92282.1 DUF4345 domain-containing protein [Rhodovarius crocodyli]
MALPSRLLLQGAVAVGGLVPVLAGGAGALGGPAALGLDVGGADAGSHFRYLSGLLLAIGLGFWSCIPGIERRGRRFALLTGLVVLGGLARLGGLAADGVPSAPMAAALVMELAVTPLLCLWQRRLAG